MASDNLPAGFRLPLDTIADFRLYTFLDEPQRTAEALPNWPPRTHAAFPWVVGYSRFGDFFLQNPDAGKFLVVYPMRGGGSKGYDARDLTEFRETVLDTFDFHLFAFPTMAFVQEVIARVGPIPRAGGLYPDPRIRCSAARANRRPTPPATSGCSSTSSANCCGRPPEESGVLRSLRTTRREPLALSRPGALSFRRTRPRRRGHRRDPGLPAEHRAGPEVPPDGGPYPRPHRLPLLNPPTLLLTSSLIIDSRVHHTSSGSIGCPQPQEDSS